MTTVKRKSKQLGQILIELGFITPEQLETALEEHRKTPKSLGRVLIDLGMIKEADLVRALAEQVGLEFVDLNEFPIDATATVLLPEALSRRYRAIPIGERDGRLLVAMSDPANVYALDDIRTITGREVQPVVATANDVEQAIQKFSGMDSQVEAMASIAAEAVDETTAELEEAHEDAPIVKLVNAIMTQAVGDRASDVHLEPAEFNVRIRFRVDGVLHEPMPPAPKNIQGGLISRLKVMADLNIAERRVPQDGRISMKVGGRALDLRVATLPTVYGEKVVIRVLDKSNALLRLEDLGFLENAYDRFSESFRKPYGAILVTGPTGSGKSTTMYSTLNILNEESKNIITVELNGEKVNRIDLDEWPQANRRPDGSEHKFDYALKDHPRKGYIGLQDHGADCWAGIVPIAQLVGMPIPDRRVSPRGSREREIGHLSEGARFDDLLRRLARTR